MEFYKRENNNFNLIRMIAAFMVIYAHSYTIQPNGSADFIVKFSKVTHLGQLSVFIFVFLTGIYLCTSLKSSKSIKEFYIKKIIRIYPMLILTLLFTISIGAIFTTLPLKEYLTSGITKKYFIDNFFNIQNAHVLPGVFDNHPVNGMNGVLWYVTFIIRLYLVAGFLYSLKLFDNKEKANISILALLSWVLIFPSSVPLLGSNTALYGSDVFPQYTITVLIACLVYFNFPKLNIRWYHILIILLMCLIQKDFTYQNTILLWGLLAIVSAIYFGTSKLLMKIKIPDYSFTIFLFGWPISQLVCEFLPKISPMLNSIITFSITFILGFLFNITVEKYCNKILKKILDLRWIKNEKKD